MITVHIYAESGTKNFRAVQRRTMYLLELTDDLGKPIVTKDEVIEEKATYYETILHAFIRAAERLKKNAHCRLILHSGNIQLLNAITGIKAMAAEGFVDCKGNPVRYADEWKHLYCLLSGHMVWICEEKHSYHKWMMNKLQIEGKDGRT